MGHQQVLLCLGQAGQAGNRIRPVQLYPIPQAFSSGIVPTENMHVVSLGKGDRIVRKARIGRHPLFVHFPFKFRMLLQALRMSI